jgi:hypothetical protein
MSSCSDLIKSVDKDETFLIWIITGDKYGVFCTIQTDVIISHLEIPIIAKKEDTATGQVKRQGMLQLFTQNSSQMERP